MSVYDQALDCMYLLLIETFNTVSKLLKPLKGFQNGYRAGRIGSQGDNPGMFNYFELYLKV